MTPSPIRIFSIFARAFCVLLCASHLLIPTISEAATSNFILQQLVGGDVTPPSTPLNLIATPIATSQIDLAWDPSTDNHILSGYQVFRDNTQIATTTGTTYSDVGLTASTTYAYYVTAFDFSGNVSASSSVATTTTLASTTPPVTGATSTSSTSGTKIRIELVRLEVLPSQNSVILRYETRLPTRTTVQWGNTIGYELGSLAERAFSRTHETTITGLKPGTTYTFTIDGEHSLGIRGHLTESTFTTLPSKDVFPPGNVQNLRAVRSGDDILLTWDNPTDSDFARVRVIRSERFFPSDTADGWVVHDALGTEARDRDAAVTGRRLFYTVFSFDKLGNISSGAVVSIQVGDDAAIPVYVVDETVNPISLRIRDVRFIQDGTILPVAADRVIIDGTRNLTVLLPYDRVPEHLKTILVTIMNERAEEFSFLLRINAEKTGYVAELAPLGVAGSHPVRVTVFDYDTAQIGTAQGTIVSEIAHFPETSAPAQSFFSYLMNITILRYGSYLIAFTLLMFTLLYLSKRMMRSGKREGREY